MAVNVLNVLLCLSATVAAVYSNALPTQETLVITNSDDTKIASETTVSEVTTEEPNAPVKLTEMHVHSDITMRYAHTAIVTKVENPAKRAQEATFRVLLPETAFISGFVMILDGKPYKAYVKEKEEAKNIYKEAVSQGFGAAHIATKARDSNVFTVSVNVEPNSVAVFNLTYEELLARRNGVYNHAVNLHPGSLVPKLTVTVHIKETQKITELRVPEIRTGNEIDATEEDAQNTNAVIERNRNQREATITFIPDLEQQKKLIEIYLEKSREQQTNKYNYGEEEKPLDGVLGQFVVQYDIDRSKGNEVLVNDGYFVHFFAPTSLPPLSKHVVFVLDTSGSMMGRKIEQLIVAMKTILSKLNPGDVFNIVQFDSSVKVLDIKAASESAPPPPKRTFYYQDPSFVMPPLLLPVEATPENIAKAKILVSRLEANGGTNIATALDVAVALTHLKKTSVLNTTTEATTTPKVEDPQTSTTIESLPTPEAEALVVTKPEDKTTKNEREPIIIFLTDGEPTVGESNPARIIRIVAEKNFGEHKASIFSLAFGEDADRSFLRKLSLRNDGFARYIYEAADAAIQIGNMYQQISSPLLADVKFSYPPNQVKEGTLTKSKFRRFYAGSEAIVAGRIANDASEISPHIYGFCGVDNDDVGKKRYEVSTQTPVKSGRDFLPLERLWAYLTIQQLLDERHIADISDDDENSPAKKALAIALKYEFVTPLTSLVVVKPNATSAVNAESADSNKALAQALAPPILGFAHPMSFPIVAQSGQFASGSPGVLYSQSLYPVPLSQPVPVQDTSFGDISDFHEDALAVEDYGVQPARLHTLSGSISTYSEKSEFRPLMFDGLRGSVSSYSTRSDIDITSTLVPLSTTVNPLEEYHLSYFPWMRSLLNSSAAMITLHTNSSQVGLKLSKDPVPPKSSKGDEECSNGTDGSTGLCVYVSRCEVARHITAELYLRTYCVVGDGYAGVCCPNDKVDAISQ